MDYRKQKELWGKGEQEQRERWEAKKLEEVTDITLRGLEPEIQRIVSSSKRDIQRIEDNTETLSNQFRTEMNAQFESNLRHIKKGIFDREEEEKLHIVDRLSLIHI